MSACWIAVTAATLVALSAPAARAAEPPRFEARTERIGSSVHGRSITARVRGRSDASVDVLVVGVIHGSERAGLPVVRRLMRQVPPAKVRYWLVPAMNPDGQRRGTRQNARGVDLNRNFPSDWRSGGRPWDVYFPGRAAASEPETRVMQRLIRRVRPDVTIWYHQHLDMVIRPPLPWRVALARVYERASGLAVRRYPGGRLHGTAVAWQHAEQPRSAAFVIELPAGELGSRGVQRHAEAVRRLAIAAAHDDVLAP